MQFHHPPGSLLKVKELLALLEPFAMHWQEWTSSGASFLSPSEILIIENYLRDGTHDASMKELRLSFATIDFVMQLSISRLRRNHHQFRKWLTEKLLEDAGVISYSSEQARFLHSPLVFLGIPYSLKSELKYLRESCMADVLRHYSEEELRQCWFMTERGIMELKEVLENVGCLGMLK
jgi:hypothetical protein